jgi:hypothetical protein
MLNRKFDFGAVDSGFPIPAPLLAMSLDEFRSNSAILSLKAGKLATIGSDGNIRLAQAADGKFAGFIVNDAAGYSFENVPAYASGKVPLMIGGGVVESDMVVEDDLVSGDRLYIADGELTKVDPSTDGSAPVFAIVKVGNAGRTDKTIELQF